MNVCKPALGAASLLLVLAGCVTIPNGPSQMVLPGSGRNFDEFRTDDLTCRQYAHDQIGGRTGQVAAEDSGVRSAAIGTLIGAAAGAAINGGTGAAVGAGQCMYAKGHRVPVDGRLSEQPVQRPPAASPAVTPPPPPAGLPPAPPSGVIR